MTDHSKIMNALGWHFLFGPPPVDVEDRLNRLRSYLRTDLPDGLADFLRNYPLTVFDNPVAFPITGDCLWGISAEVDLFLGFDDDLYDIIRTAELQHGSDMSESLLPFACCQGGNFVCICVSGPLRGNVFFWDHEHGELEEDAFQRRVEELEAAGIDTQHMDVGQILVEWERLLRPESEQVKPPGWGNVYKVADSFDAFLSSLFIDNDDEAGGDR